MTERCVPSEVAVDETLEPLGGHPGNGAEDDDRSFEVLQRHLAAIFRVERLDARDVLAVLERALVAVGSRDTDACVFLGVTQRL